MSDGVQFLLDRVNLFLQTEMFLIISMEPEIGKMVGAYIVQLYHFVGKKHGIAH